jgi:hypothetical protein
MMVIVLINLHLQGRKYGIRVWLLISGVNPLRAYLHSNGLVLFSTHGYDDSSWVGEAGGVALGHVTNYAQVSRQQAADCLQPM